MRPVSPRLSVEPPVASESTFCFVAGVPDVARTKVADHWLTARREKINATSNISIKIATSPASNSRRCGWGVGKSPVSGQNNYWVGLYSAGWGCCSFGQNLIGLPGKSLSNLTSLIFWLPLPPKKRNLPTNIERLIKNTCLQICARNLFSKKCVTRLKRVRILFYCCLVKGPLCQIYFYEHCEHM